MKKQVYGYIRVSTTKQGQGVSLQEQKSSIIAYAEKHGLEIIEWFEEQRSASKRGRTEFNRMIKLLKRGKAQGVVIHKIDRSARNIRDWASINELSDRGIEVHFSHESLDLNTRGNRLVADVQAVISADYIRNLREEREKGFYGRLKQGLYPLAAPIGYLDNGKGGKVKTIDPAKKDLVIEAFKLYASGNHTVRSLAKLLTQKGLTNSKGKKVEKEGIRRMLRNPFYMGLIKIYSTGQTYHGVHEPLISSDLFDQVQGALDGKIARKPVRHAHLYSKIISCQDCNRKLIAEIQKGRTYYRCHTTGCGNSIREDVFENTLSKLFSAMQFSRSAKKSFMEYIGRMRTSHHQKLDQQNKSIELATGKLEKKLDSLNDLLIDGVIDKEVYIKKKEELEYQKLKLYESEEDRKQGTAFEKFLEKLELSQSLAQQYFSSEREEKREMLLHITSNLYMSDKNLVFELKNPYCLFVTDQPVSFSGRLLDNAGTFSFTSKAKKQQKDESNVISNIKRYIDTNLV